MDPELKYTQINVRQYFPQLMPVINEEPVNIDDTSQPSIHMRRDSIAIHPVFDCSNCCCYFCCGCTELYTPVEMVTNKNKLTLLPLTSSVINPALATDYVLDEHPNENLGKPTSSTNPGVCLLSPFTMVIDLVTFGPRCLINICK